MAGHTDTTIIVILLTSEVVFAQSGRSTGKSNSTISDPDIPSVILFYTSPIITLVVLILGVFCATQIFKACQKRTSTTARNPTLPTISESVQTGNASDVEPPPPYTFIEINSDVTAEISVSNCPPYSKEPPSYIELMNMSNNVSRNNNS